MFGIQIEAFPVGASQIRAGQTLSEVILRYFITRSWCKHFNTRSRQS